MLLVVDGGQRNVAVDKRERNVSKAFGVSHEALGQRVHEFARGVGGG